MPNIIQRKIAELVLGKENTVQRANQPLAAMRSSSGGLGLTTSQIQEFLALLGVESTSRKDLGSLYQSSIPVYASIRLRARAVARARLKVYRRNAGSDDLMWQGEDHPVQKLLDKGNRWWTRSRMWGAAETHLNIWGSSFRWVEKPDRDDVSTWGMWHLRPDRVMIVPDQSIRSDNTYIKGFIHDPHGSRFPILPDDMIWDRYYNPLNEFAGLSPLLSGLNSIEMHEEAIKLNRQLFKKGVLASNWAFFLTGPVDPDEITEFQDTIERKYSGTENAGRPIVFDKGLGDVKNLGFSNKEMEFLEGLQFSKEMILMLLGIEEEMMPGARHATFSNRAEANKHFYQNTITDEWDMLEAEMQEQFVPTLPPEHQDLILKFDKTTVEALSATLSEKALEYTALMDQGVMTINEVATELGISLKAWGDVWWAPPGLTPIEDPDSFVPPPPPMLPQPPSGEDEEEDEDEEEEEEATEEDEDDARRLRAKSLTRRLAPSIPEYALFRKQRSRALEEEREALDLQCWESFCRRVDETTVQFQDVQNQLFAEQMEGVMSSVRIHFISLQRSYKALRFGADGEFRQIAATKIFDVDQWSGLFIRAGRSVMASSLARSAEQQGKEFRMPGSFEISRATPQAWIDERTAFWARRVNETTGQMLLEEVEASNEAGEGIAKLQDRIESLFQISSAVRTESIARTEMTAAANQGHLEAYRQAGVPSKRWLASLDGRTRATHANAHGQIVDIDQAFTVGGEKLMVPGQGEAGSSAGNVIQCRCTTTPVFEQTQQVHGVEVPSSVAQGRERTKTVVDSLNSMTVDLGKTPLEILNQVDINRNRIIRDMPEAKPLVNTISRWTMDSKDIRRLSLNHLKGLSTADEGTLQFLEAIDESEDTEIPLFRGLGFPSREKADLFLNDSIDGDEIDIPISSFSSDVEVGKKFAIKSGGVGENGVIFQVKGSKRAINISPISGFPEEQEWVTHGKFKVSNIIRSESIDQFTIVEIEQIATPKIIRSR